MTHIGTLTDKSYYQEYERIKGNRIYYYLICPYCEKEYESGFSDLNGGNRVAAQHKCEPATHEVHLRLHIDFVCGLFEWGQFIFNWA